MRSVPTGHEGLLEVSSSLINEEEAETAPVDVELDNSHPDSRTNRLTSISSDTDTMNDVSDTLTAGSDTITVGSDNMTADSDTMTIVSDTNSDMLSVIDDHEDSQHVVQIHSEQDGTY